MNIPDSIYNYGDTVYLEAIPDEGYEFRGWSDGSMENPRMVLVTEDLFLEADFLPKEYWIDTNSTMGGTVHGAGQYFYGDTAYLEAIPEEGYEFRGWRDGSMENPRIVFVTEDLFLEADFLPEEYWIDANSTMGGTVHGAGRYFYGDTVYLEAIPDEGFEFEGWSDGNMENPRIVIVYDNIDFKAIFGKEESDIYEVLSENVTISVFDNQLVVNGTEDYSVYTITGVSLGKPTYLESGVYLVQIGKVYKKVLVE